MGAVLFKGPVKDDIYSLRSGTSDKGLAELALVCKNYCFFDFSHRGYSLNNDIIVIHSICSSRQLVVASHSFYFYVSYPSSSYTTRCLGSGHQHLLKWL